MKNKEALIKEVNDLIEEKGLEAVKDAFYPILHKMVVGSKTKESLGVHLILFGYSQYDPDGLTVIIDLIIQAVPESDERRPDMIETYNYWLENQEQIMFDHGMTRG